MAEVALRLFGHDPMVVGFRQRFYSTADYPHRLVYSVGDVAVDPLDVSKTAA
eukprot:gene12129-25740_t